MLCLLSSGRSVMYVPLPMPRRPFPSPMTTAAALRHLPGLVFLDSACTAPGAQSFVTAAPESILRGHIDHDWHLVTDTLRSRSSSATSGGLYGWVGFDGHFVFGVYSHVLAFDHDDQTWRTSGELAAQCREHSPAPSPPLHFTHQVSREHYLGMVKRAQDYIAAGDIYQVNLAFPWLAHWPRDADAIAFYERLRQTSPAPHAAFLDLDGTRLFCSSPESFLRMSGRHICTRPIKGTRPRHPSDAQRDHASAAALAASAKENAELLMITDLERNDLGQVCEFGSIRVPELATVEQFAQVFHLVSTVEGTLRTDIDHASAFKACFPGGSITGAPKKRALEIIHELEPHPRGIYTGAIGGFGFDGETRFNIAIRTAVQQGDTITFHTGAGIVADSVPELEWEETLHKAAGLLGASGVA